MGRSFDPVEASPTIVRKLYDDQRGRCIRSFVLLSFLANSNWLMSLERLDDSLGYIEGNMALIAVEFNTARHLTSGKADYAFNPLNQAWQSESDRVQGVARLSVELGRVGPGDYNLTSTPPPNKFAQSKLKICRACGIKQPADGFGTGTRICRPCVNSKQLTRGRTVLGFVQRLLGNARDHIRKINKTRNASERVDLTPSQVLDLLWDQEGRCGVGGLLISLRPGTDWQASLERLDTSKGYTKDNVKIICVEFNSTVRISVREEAPTGSGQMTPQKFAHATACYQAEMARINQVSQGPSVKTD
jgi:hypothetical protein